VEDGFEGRIYPCRSIQKTLSKLLVFELTNNLCMVNTNGMFGHTEMPIIFDVISRVLRRIGNAVIDKESECDVYVDDLMAGYWVNRKSPV
jgi:hypothetical protein